MSSREKLKELVKAAAGGTLNADQIIEICDNTLKTAREIRALLEGLDLGYKEALENLKNLEKRLDGKIKDFFAKAKPIEDMLKEALIEMEKTMAEIEAIKPEIQKVKELAEKAEQSLIRLEEINTNITQIEQRLREILSKINIDEFEERVKTIYATFERNIKMHEEEVDNQLQGAMEAISNLLAELDAKVKGWIKDLNDLNTKIQQEINALGDKIKNEIETLGSQSKQEITDLTTQSKQEITTLTDKGKQEITDLTTQSKQEITDLTTQSKQEITTLTDKGKQEITDLTDNKKGEITDLAQEKLDEISLVGATTNKTITFKTIDEASTVNGYIYQEVIKDASGRIVFYGDFYMKVPGGTLQRVRLPNNIEFDYCFVYKGAMAFRPKKGQTLNGKSLDNDIFTNASGFTFSPNTWYSLPARPKRLMFAGRSTGTYSLFALMENGDLYGRGYNEYGVLGLGDSNSRNNFIKVRDRVDDFVGRAGGNICVIRNGNMEIAGYYMAGVIESYPYGVWKLLFKEEQWIGYDESDSSVLAYSFRFGSGSVASRYRGIDWGDWVNTHLDEGVTKLNIQEQQIIGAGTNGYNLAVLGGGGFRKSGIFYSMGGVNLFEKGFRFIYNTEAGVAYSEHRKEAYVVYLGGEYMYGQYGVREGGKSIKIPNLVKLPLTAKEMEIRVFDNGGANTGSSFLAVIADGDLYLANVDNLSFDQSDILNKQRY